MDKKTMKYLKAVRRRKLLKEGRLYIREKVHRSGKEYRRVKRVEVDGRD